MKTGFKSLLIVGLMAGAALGANAQNTAPNTAGASSPDMHRGHMDPAKMEAKLAKHLAELKTKLKITPSQEVAWSTFAAALKPPARIAHTRPDPAEMERLTLPQRMDKMQAIRAQHMSASQAQREKREEAVKTFYATLDNDQKSTMDAAHSKMLQRWSEHKGMGHGANH
jgi:periplasmic protein CpxP/Spy